MDTVLYDAGGLRVGAFRRYPWQRPFEDTGPIQGFLLVFPRTSVVIEHEGRAPVVADPTRVMLYNRGQTYRRRALSERGDECEWFSFPAELVADALRARDPGVDERLDRPFRGTHAPADARAYLLQRRVVEHLAARAARGEAPDALFVEEAMMQLLARCTLGQVDASAPSEGHASSESRGATHVDHRAIADACRTLLAARLGDPLSLGAIARRVGVSPFHLARVFHRDAGTTLHAYRHDLRMRTALERVTAGEDLARIAVELGYASHSHFTARFRRTFGATPSAVRERARS
jgi:AraC-like DNA-binding protein